MNGFNAKAVTMLYNIVVLVYANQRSGVEEWMQLNEEWLRSVRATVSQASFVERRLSLEAVADAQAFDDSEIEEQKQLLFVHPTWILRPSWLDVIAKANSHRSLGSATGRLLREQSSAEGRYFVDAAPKLIANSVDQWVFSPAMHGVTCLSLPAEVLWVNEILATWFLASLRSSHSLSEALDLFFKFNTFSHRRNVHAYLPDFIAIHK